MARKKELYEVLTQLRFQEKTTKASIVGKKSPKKKEPEGTPILKSFGERQITITYNNAIIMFGVGAVLLTLAFFGGSYFGKSGESDTPANLSINVPAKAEKSRPGTQDVKKPETYRYTVQVITYNNTERNKKRAGELVDFFESHNLGKTVVKEDRNNTLVVCVGFSETKDEAEKRRVKISKMAIRKGAKEERPFKDALIKRVRMRTN